MAETERIELALQIAQQHGQTDGAHHKAWVIDQIVRVLTGCPVVPRVGTDYQGTAYMYNALGESPEYHAFITAYRGDEDGTETYGEWDEGIAP